MRVSSSYEHALQAVYYHIGNRGICVNTDKIAHAQRIVAADIARHLAIATKQWGCTVFAGKANAPTEKSELANSVNLNATQGERALLKKMQDLGYEVPKIAKKNDDGEYESNYSTGELALQKMLAKNQFGYPGGDPAIKAILRVRELGKLRNSYLNARLLERAGLAYFLTNYNAAGTLSGRRGSRKHTFRLGGNAQNPPKHSDIAYLYRECWVARPGNVLLMVDQMSAEDWPVSALAMNYQALKELADESDLYGRHTRLASVLFNLPLTSKTPKEWKDSMERYLGKKTRHASNYDMRAPRMADALAQEGYSFSEDQCNRLLSRMAAIDPSIQKVFHAYVKAQISSTRTLITPEPFCRERQFLGFRPNDANSSLFKEAFAFIPQSTVADNTGYAVLELETKYPSGERCIVQEGHDSVVQDIEDNAEQVFLSLTRTQLAFHRVIKFHNGIELEIPIEAEIGYDFETTVGIKKFTLEACREALEKLRDKRAEKAKQEAATAVAI